jgi:hypothetical protein
MFEHALFRKILAPQVQIGVVGHQQHYTGMTGSLRKSAWRKRAVRDGRKEAGNGERASYCLAGEDENSALVELREDSRKKCLPERRICHITS